MHSWFTMGSVSDSSISMKFFFARFYNKFFCSDRKVSIGGGKVAWPDWRIFDAISVEPRDRIIFSQQTVIPIKTDSVEIVYSSHFFEHLDDECLSQVISEAFRILEPNGILLVKLPDFDLVLEKLKSRDHSFFDKWGMHKLLRLWENCGVADTIENRASMIFCGVWNQAYGDHFSGKINLSGDAYHGPVPGGGEKLLQIVDMKPSEISRELVHSLKGKWEFNHRNAWSFSEFSNLLQGHGFEVISKEEKKVMNEFQFIPDIGKMGEISKYYLARKPYAGD